MSYTNQPPYTNVAIASQIRERMALCIEREVPELAPELPFVRLIKFPAQAPLGDQTEAGGEPAYQQLDKTTDAQRWRSFRIRPGGWVEGDNSDNETGKNYVYRVIVQIGYPLEPLIKPNVEDDSTVYDSDALIDHDFEQLNDALCGLDIFAATNPYGEPEIAGVDNVDLQGSVMSGNIHQISYLIRYERVRAAL